MPGAWRIRMRELDPRELIELTSRTGHHEPCRHNGRRPAPASAVLVDVSGQVRPIDMPLELEQARVDRRQQPAAWAPEPTRKRDHRDTGPSPLVERISRLLQPWRGAKFGNLITQLSLDRGEEARLGQHLLVRVVPRIEASHHDREVRQVDRRPDAECVHQLAWSNRTDARRLLPLHRHDGASSTPPSGGTSSSISGGAGPPSPETTRAPEPLNVPHRG